jgi:hypothetical protein
MPKILYFILEDILLLIVNILHNKFKIGCFQIQSVIAKWIIIHGLLTDKIKIYSEQSFDYVEDYFGKLCLKIIMSANEFHVVLYMCKLSQVIYLCHYYPWIVHIQIITLAIWFWV